MICRSLSWSLKPSEDPDSDIHILSSLFRRSLQLCLIEGLIHRKYEPLDNMTVHLPGFQPLYRMVNHTFNLLFVCGGPNLKENYMSEMYHACLTVLKLWLLNKFPSCDNIHCLVLKCEYRTVASTSRVWAAVEMVLNILWPYRIDNNVDQNGLYVQHVPEFRKYVDSRPVTFGIWLWPVWYYRRIPLRGHLCSWPGVKLSYSWYSPCH